MACDQTAEKHEQSGLRFSQSLERREHDCQIALLLSQYDGWRVRLGG
jgi:hypothetical protein